jgi:hypothetical protein
VGGDAIDALRLASALAQCEIALVRRDPVAPALVAQAARHAESLAPGPLLAAAARLARDVDVTGRGAGQEAARKVVQALCRVAAARAEAAALGGVPIGRALDGQLAKGGDGQLAKRADA